METEPARGLIASREELESCQALVRELIEYWDRKRGARRMPRRQDIDPADFPRHLPCVLLVDVQEAPRRFVYRLVGTREVAARGYDPTGKEVAEHFLGPSREDVLGCYQRVCESRSFLVDPNGFLAPSGEYLREETLFLPLSQDGERVSQILVYAHDVKQVPYRSLAERARREERATLPDRRRRSR